MNTDVMVVIALSGDAQTFRAMAATNRALRGACNSAAVQREAKARFTRRCLTVDGTRRWSSFHLPDGRKHGEEQCGYAEEEHCRYRCQWVDGQHHGCEEWFARSGTRTHRAEWSEGTLVSEQSFECGELLVVQHTSFAETPWMCLVDGNRHGPTFLDDDSGVRRWRQPYVCGQKHGIHQVWWKNPDGLWVGRSEYKRGNHHGTSETRNGRGVLVRRVHWKEGVLDGTDETWTDEGVLLVDRSWFKEGFRQTASPTP